MVRYNSNLEKTASKSTGTVSKQRWGGGDRHISFVFSNKQYRLQKRNMPVAGIDL